MSVSAGAAGILLSSRFFSHAKPAETVAPRPIAGGLQFLAPGDLTVFHVKAPGYPGSGLDPATNDPSLITDFNGQVGLAYVRGTGTHSALGTLPFEVDLRFMRGVYVGSDGKHHNRTFALIWLDVFDQSGQQIHDLNPGITPSGLFWVAAIDSQAVEVHPGDGRASMQVSDFSIPDYHDFLNSLLVGPTGQAVASFRIDWAAAHEKHHFHDAGNGFDANLVFNVAQVQWTAHGDTWNFVSDPASTSTSLFGEVGQERNGIFF